MARGRLRVYLGAAPGVGKTHAMLEEGQRRAGRGADVVIGVLDATGRPLVETLADDWSGRRLEGQAALPSWTSRRCAARRPQVVLVDNLAHRVDEQTGRWDAVDELLADGIDVITTVNISNLESMGDIVATIIGSSPSETVPDSVVRAADQIELVDMSPEALASPARPRARLPTRPNRHRAGQSVSSGGARQTAPADPAVARRSGRGTARTTAWPTSPTRPAAFASGWSSPSAARVVTISCGARHGSPVARAPTWSACTSSVRAVARPRPRAPARLARRARRRLPRDHRRR